MVTAEHRGIIAPVGEEFRVRAPHALPAAKVRELSRLSAARSTFSVVGDIAIGALAVAIAVKFPRAWVVVPAIVVVAAIQHGLAILSHQAAHYRLYESRWLNDFVGKLCAIPLGLSLITYRVMHRTHHNHLYTSIDPDLALIADYPRGKAYLLGKLAKDLLGLTVLKSYGYFFGKPVQKKGVRFAVEKPHDDTSSTLRQRAKRDRILVVCLHIAFLWLAVVLGFWKWYLLLWVLPLLTVLQAMLRLRAVLEHGAVESTTDVLRAARTTVAPVYVRFFLYPHYMNFHIEHHLYPSVPHYNLPACHAALVEAGITANAEVQNDVRISFSKVFAARG